VTRTRSGSLRDTIVRMSLKKIPGVVVKPLLLPTYLAMIEASVGSTLFRTFWAEVNGKRTDIVRGGRVSCSFFVSSILKLFNLAQEVQVTVTRLRLDMERGGWQEISRPRKGCVVIWAEKPAGSARMKKDAGTYQPMVRHCGFFVGNGTCVTNDGEETLAPRLMPLKYRPVEGYFWHEALEAGHAMPEKAAPARKPGLYWHPNKA